MFKKILIGGGILTVVAVALLGRTAISHVKHAFHWARDGVKDAMPIEYQLEQAERTIDDMIPEIDASKRVVAQEQVEIRYLQDEIARLERVQTDDGARIQASSAALKSGTVQLVVAGRPYSRAGLENDVRLALRKHQTNQGLLESKRRLLDARERSLAAAQQKLAAVCGEKENLVIAVEQLRARLRETQALEASSCRIDLDDTKLAEAKETIARVRKRLDVAQQLLENDSGGILEIPETDPQVDVTSEVDRYFGAASDKSGLTAKSR